VTDVLTALGHEWEPVVATVLERVPGVTIARRCADVAELLAVSEAGLGDVAVVSSDLRGLDLEVVKRLRDRRIRVLGLHEPGEEASERRLHQLGIGRALPCDATAERFASALADDPSRDELGDCWDASAADDIGPRPGADASGMPPGDEAVLWRPSGAPDGDTRPTGGGRHTEAGARPAVSPRAKGGARRKASRRHTADGAAAASAAARRPDRAPVIAVWGPAGAPGRTTIATGLAAELASRGTEVLLVDADTYGGSVAQALGLLDEAPGVAAACRAADHGTLDLPALAELAPEIVAGLRVLTGLPKAERWLEVRAGALERVLALAPELVDAVVVDCGFCIEDDEELSYDTLAPRRNEATLTSLAASDVVVAVGRADPVGLQRFVRGLQELGTVPSGEPVPVVNRVRAAAVGSRPQGRISDSLIRFAGIQDVRFVPDDPATLDAALLAGRSIVEQAPGSPVRAALAELATAVAPWTAPAESASGRSRSRWSGSRWSRSLWTRSLWTRSRWSRSRWSGSRRHDAASGNAIRTGDSARVGDTTAGADRVASNGPGGSRRSRRVRA
jgi:MinD-like ATPase involved in chromosome partitioning or flagellar assembly